MSPCWILRWRTVLAALLLSTLSLGATAVEVRFERVADNVYTHVGDIGGRSVANEGLNANIGLVVTPAGAVLIDSGATFNSARDIHTAVRRVTDQPVRWVINTGGQDHRWLGNGYFQAQGAFAGDIVYVDRLLDVLPVSSTRAWLEAFSAREQWAPRLIVPGQGCRLQPCTDRTDCLRGRQALAHAQCSDGP